MNEEISKLSESRKPCGKFEAREMEGQGRGREKGYEARIIQSAEEDSISKLSR